MDNATEYLWILEARNFVGSVLSSGIPFIDFLVGILAYKVFSNGIRERVTTFYTFLGTFFNREERHHKGELVSESLEEAYSYNSSFFHPQRLYKVALSRVLKPGVIDTVKKFKTRWMELVTWDDCDDEEVTTTEFFYEPADESPVQVEDGVFVLVTDPGAFEQEANNEHRSTRAIGVNVFSETKTVGELVQLVDKWEQEFLEERTTRMGDKRMIFQVQFNAKENVQTSVTKFCSNRKFDNFFFEGKENILKEIDSFLYNKEWYVRRGMPDALGLLCSGEPGCGKTSFIKCLLNKTQRHAVVFSLNRNADLKEIEKLMRTDVICDLKIPQDQRIYIFEDVDCMGDIVLRRQGKDVPTNSVDTDSLKKENFDPKDPKWANLMKEVPQGPATMKDAVAGDETAKFLSLLIDRPKNAGDNTMSFFLNLLDGIVETPGRMVVMTTNYPEKLDPAITRPGRIDLKLVFSRCSHEILQQILQQFYPTATIPDLNRFHLIFTPARIVELCKSQRRDVEMLILKLDEELRAGPNFIESVETPNKEVENEVRVNAIETIKEDQGNVNECDVQMVEKDHISKDVENKKYQSCRTCYRLTCAMNDLTLKLKQTA